MISTVAARHDPAVPPDLAFLANCCSAGFARSAPAALQPRPVDWERIVAAARFHRVQALVHAAMESAGDVMPPAAARDALAADAEAIVAANLRDAEEVAALHAAFAAAGVDLLVVKGLALAPLAYAKPFLKMSGDIDLLVAPADLEGAADLLSARGFALAQPVDRTRLPGWHRRRKESAWRRGGQIVDLHTALADNPRLIPAVGMASERQSVALAGSSLRTLADAPLLAYLSVHGASSAWFRLKWIADFAGFLGGRSPHAIAALHDQAVALGAGRSVAQAMLLADRLFGTLGGTDLAERLRRDRGTRWLAAAGWRQLAGNRALAEPTATLFGTARIHLAQLPLQRGIAFPVAELGRQIGAAIEGRRGA